MSDNFIKLTPEELKDLISEAVFSGMVAFQSYLETQMDEENLEDDLEPQLSTGQKSYLNQKLEIIIKEQPVNNVMVDIWLMKYFNKYPELILPFLEKLNNHEEVDELEYSQNQGRIKIIKIKWKL